MPRSIITILLLIASNTFMTIAWYGHLRYKDIALLKNAGLFTTILISWGIALLEYMLMVPANRTGYAKGMSGFQLKMLQEVITLLVFTIFAVYYLKEPFHWRYLVSFVLLMGAVWFMFTKQFG